jgi:outer membrane receptor protein involved in Fe transport
MKAAFKWDDVWVQYKDGLKRKPLVPIFKALLNLNYTTKNKKFLFNTTVQWYSRTRIPNTTGNPTEFQLPAYSKGYINLLAQINYFITKRWEIYLGGENLTNYQQPNAIIDAKKPFGNNFDASLIYGPVDGIRIYVGFRFNLPYDKSKRLEK